MKYIAVFDDKDLSNFRVDKGGRTGYEKVLVVRDETYSTRGIGLRPLPEKQKLTVIGKNQIEKTKAIESKSLEWIKKGYINNPEVAFYCGYNACLDEILGEENDSMS